MAEARQVAITTELVMAWFVRAIIIAGLSAGGWLGTRIFSKVDDTAVAVHSHDIKLEQLNAGNQMISSKLNDIHESLQDHEKRIRDLERPLPVPPH